LEYGIVCDDIRQEVGHKLSFLGVYGREPDILVAILPFSFVKLCFAFSISNIKGGDSFTIKVIDPSGKELAQSINGNVPEGTKLQHSVPFYPSFAPLQVKTEGLHRLVTTFNEDEKLNIEFRFNIKLIKKQG